MLSPIELIGAACFGGLLAIVYFGGLWWTIRQLSTSQHPIATYFGSLFARLTVALLGFFVLAAYCPWQALAACIVGFMVARLMLVHFLGSQYFYPADGTRRDR